jgi:hypothetical protein
MLAFKHSFMVVTTDFDLEPVLEKYLETYPNGGVEGYNIVFQVEGEHQEGHKSYIIVFTLRQHPPKEYAPRFDEYLSSYCRVNNGVAFVNPSNSVLPKIHARQVQGYHVYGNPAKYEK